MNRNSNGEISSLRDRKDVGMNFMDSKIEIRNITNAGRVRMICLFLPRQSKSINRHFDIYLVDIVNIGEWIILIIA